MMYEHTMAAYVKKTVMPHRNTVKTGMHRRRYGKKEGK